VLVQAGPHARVLVVSTAVKRIDAIKSFYSAGCGPYMTVCGISMVIYGRSAAIRRKTHRVDQVKCLRKTLTFFQTVSQLTLDLGALFVGLLCSPPGTCQTANSRQYYYCVALLRP
jgi:hypothetical protein